MKKAFSIILSILLALSITGPVFAAGKDKPKVIQRTGEVATIDVAARSLTLKYKTDTIIITINENTLVKMNKEKKSPSDIKVGDIVKVWFFEKDKVAKSIEIKSVK